MRAFSLMGRRSRRPLLALATALLVSLLLLVGPVYGQAGEPATSPRASAPMLPRIAQEPTATVSPALTPTVARGFGTRPRPTPPPLPLWIALAGVLGVAVTLGLVFWGRRARR